MIKNYFIIAIRNIRRYTAYSILNISGMAIGLACSILIFLWVIDEWTYDRHFKDADNIYRVLESPNPADGEMPYAVSSNPLAAVLKSEYPEIIRSSRYSPALLTLKKENEATEEKNVAVVDKDFLKMFDIDFVQGDINTALDAPHNIILTEEMAHKYFGNENALGKTLESSDHLKTVTGVIKNLPHNSQFRFGILAPFDWLKERGVPLNEWWIRCYNYVQLKNGTDSKLTDIKIRNVVKKYNKTWNAEIFLQNIKNIHLYSSRKYTYDVDGLGDITYVRILAIIAVFILCIACINFMNLATAQSTRRAKEIGIRKTAGAKRQKIIFQFLGESMLIVFIANIIALILVESLLPGFNKLSGKQLAISYNSAGLYIGLTGILFFCGLLAGSYPALYLSSLKPLDTMKGYFDKNQGNRKFRRVLVIFQFSISILLIICTLVIGDQLRYMQNKDLGFNKNNIGYFRFPTREDDPRLETIKKELLNNPDILSVTKAQSNPLNVEAVYNNLIWRGKKKGDEVLIYELSADADYDKTFELQTVVGRFFSPELNTDSNAIVINEKAAKLMGFKNPIGEIVTIYNLKCPIIGVVKDFHFRPLHYRIEPLIIEIRRSNIFFVRMKPGNIVSTVESINKIYDSFKPPFPMEFHFLDNDFDHLYWTEKKLGVIFSYFSFLAIFISCLGLVGLSTFLIECRTKEIGIRKANGAKSNEIYYLLSKEYVVLVAGSFIIATPVAWFAMNKWLQNFAYHTNVSLLTFALSGIIILVIMLLTVSFQSYKAARKNPVEALKYE